MDHLGCRSRSVLNFNIYVLESNVGMSESYGCNELFGVFLVYFGLFWFIWSTRFKLRELDIFLILCHIP